VKYQEANKESAPEPEAALDRVVKAMSEGGKLLNLKKETLDRYPARRFAIEDADKDTFDVRSVVTDRYFIQVMFLGPVGNSLGKRFLDSFAIAEP